MTTERPFEIDTKSYPGIVKINFMDDHEITFNDVLLCYKELETLVKGKPMPILKVPGKFSSVDAEARKFISSEEGMKLSVAEAFVTTFLPHRIIGNFYLKFNKPEKPTVFFNDEESAVKWLQQFIKQ